MATDERAGAADGARRGARRAATGWRRIAPHHRARPGLRAVLRQRRVGVHRGGALRLLRVPARQDRGPRRRVRGGLRGRGGRGHRGDRQRARRAVGRCRASSTTSRSSRPAARRSRGSSSRRRRRCGSWRRATRPASRRWARRSWCSPTPSSRSCIASYNTVRANTQEPVPGHRGGEGRRAARGHPRPVGPGQRPRAARRSPSRTCPRSRGRPPTRRRRSATGCSWCPVSAAAAAR